MSSGGGDRLPIGQASCFQPWLGPNLGLPVLAPNPLASESLLHIYLKHYEAETTPFKLAQT